MTRKSDSPRAQPTWSAPFHLEQEEGGHFYALAWCAAMAPQDAPREVRLTLYFSPSPDFSRFSFFAHDGAGACWVYHRGPEHSPTVDAALLNAWVTLAVPAFAWRLFPMPTGDAFAEPVHATGYRAARYELCRSLHGIRVTAWSGKELASPPLILPPLGGFQPVDAFESSDENAELLGAAVDEDQPVD
jgi:hypothetical protein